jgi:sugar lactone lactonase YvrE
MGAQETVIRSAGGGTATSTARREFRLRVKREPKRVNPDRVSGRLNPPGSWPTVAADIPAEPEQIDPKSREASMQRSLASLSAVILTLCAGPALAQLKATAQNVPEIPYDSVPNFLKLPAGEYLGESVGVATNSKGHTFVYHRSATTRLFEFDQNGNFLKEIGKGYYGFEFAHSVRVDAEDNIWTVDEGTNVVTKFSPEGKVLMVLGRRPAAVNGALTTSGEAQNQKYIFCRPTDVGWDPQGDIFVSDGYCNNRVMKYDRNGRFLAQVGSEKAGKEPGQFNLPHGLQVDGQGNVYVADRTNFRYQVLDNNLKPKAVYDNVGVGWTVCVSQGPHQYLFASNSNPNGNRPGSWAITGEIYKMELNGTILGRFGHASKEFGGFQVVHMMDCRNPNEIVVGEIESWRVQKLILKPQAAQAVTR